MKIRLCIVHAHWPISMQFNELLQERYVLIEGNYREFAKHYADGKLYDTKAAESDGCLLMAYKCKKSKWCVLLSTLHQSIDIAGKINCTMIYIVSSSKWGFRTSCTQ